MSMSAIAVSVTIKNRYKIIRIFVLFYMFRTNIYKWQAIYGLQSEMAE
jgi:hypothetical protein